MLAGVKKCADNGDIKGLRYIFLDSLDVDPTFEGYRREYEFCKGIEGMFEGHEELKGFILDQSRWDLQYWVQLKLDLKKNFSQKRFEHMIKVAQVVYAEKVERLLAERETKRAAAEKKLEKTALEVRGADKTEPFAIKKQVSGADAPKKMTRSEMEKECLEKAKRELEEKNTKWEAEQAAKNKARIEEEGKRKRVQPASRTGDSGSKKLAGIVLAIIVVVIVGILIAVLR